MQSSGCFGSYSAAYTLEEEGSQEIRVLSFSILEGLQNGLQVCLTMRLVHITYSYYN